MPPTFSNEAKEYARNVMKSTKYIGTRTMEGVDGDLYSFVLENARFAKDTYESARDFAHNVKDKISNFFRDATLLRDLRKNVGTDFKTGKYYNPERSEDADKAMMKAMGMDFDFDMSDDIDFDVDEGVGDDSIGEDSDESSSEGSADTSTMADRIDFSGQKSAYTTAELINKRANKNHLISFAQSERLFGTLNLSLTAINSSILKFHQDLSQPLNTYMTNVTKFTETATSELAKQTSYLENIVKLLEAKFNPPRSRRREIEDNLGDVFSGKLPKLSDWFELGIKRAKDSSDLGMFNMISGDMINALIQSELSSPVANLIAWGLAKSIKSSATGKALERFKKTLSGGLKQTAFNLHTYATSDYGFLNEIAQYFDIVPDERVNKLNFSAYNKDKTEWNGKDRKALQDIIPTQLSKIISILTGKEAKLFNYDTGKWETISESRTKFADDRLNKAKRADYEAAEKVDEAILDVLNANSYKKWDESGRKTQLRVYKKTDDDVKAILEDRAKFSLIISEMGLDLNKYKTANDFLADYIRIQNAYIKNGRDPQLDLRNVVILAEAIYGSRTTKTAALSLNAAVRLEDKKGLQRALESGTIANIENRSGIEEISNLNRNFLLDTKDDYKKNIFNYLSDIYNQLCRMGTGEPSNAIRGRNLIIPESLKNRLNKQINPVETAVEASLPTVPTDEPPNAWLNRTTSAKERGAIKQYSSLEDARSALENMYNSTKEGETSSWDQRTGQEALNRQIRESFGERGINDLTEEDKTSPLARAIDKLGNMFSNLVYGETYEEFKQKYKGETLIDTIKKVPEMIRDLGIKFLKGLGDIWTGVKNSEKGKAFREELKNTTKGIFSSAGNLATETASDLYKEFTGKEPSWKGSILPKQEGAVESPSGTTEPKAAEGGLVTRSGMVSVSEGERIIPAFKNGKRADSKQRQIEERNLLDWRKSQSLFGKGNKTPKLIKISAKETKESVVKKLNEDPDGFWDFYNNHKKDFEITNLKDNEQIETNLYVEKLNAKETPQESDPRFHIIRKTGDKKNFKSDAKIITLEKPRETPKTETKSWGSKAFDKLSNFFSENSKPAEYINEKLKLYVGDNATKQEIVNEVKKNYPQIAARGTVGAIIGAALTGSPLGLLGGFVVGSGSKILGDSEYLSKKLFGEKDQETGEYKGGILSPKVSKFIKEKLKKVGAAGTLGSILGLLGLAPGGILGGLVLGSGLQIVSSSEKAKSVLFGKMENGERQGGLIPKSWQNFFKSNYKKLGLSAGIGGLLGGLGIIPGGLFGGLAIGAGVNLVKSSDRVQNWLFGKKDEKGNRTGGLLKKMQEKVLNPLLDFAKSLPSRLSDFFKYSVWNPLKNIVDSAGRTFESIKDAILGKKTIDGKSRVGGLLGVLNKFIVDPIKGAILGVKDFFIDHVGKPIFSQVKNAIIEPTSKLVKETFDYIRGTVKEYSQKIGKWIWDKFFGGFSRTVSQLLDIPWINGKSIREVTSGIGKKISKVITVPFNFVSNMYKSGTNWVSDKIEKANVRKGYSRKNAQERMDVLNKMGLRDNNLLMQYTKYLQGEDVNKEDLETFNSLISGSLYKERDQKLNDIAANAFHRTSATLKKAGLPSRSDNPAMWKDLEELMKTEMGTGEIHAATKKNKTGSYTSHLYSKYKDILEKHGVVNNVNIGALSEIMTFLEKEDEKYNKIKNDAEFNEKEDEAKKIFKKITGKDYDRMKKHQIYKDPLSALQQQSAYDIRQLDLIQKQKEEAKKNKQQAIEEAKNADPLAGKQADLAQESVDTEKQTLEESKKTNTLLSRFWTWLTGKKPETVQEEKSKVETAEDKVKKITDGKPETETVQEEKNNEEKSKVETVKDKVEKITDVPSNKKGNNFAKNGKKEGNSAAERRKRKQNRKDRIKAKREERDEKKTIQDTIEEIIDNSTDQDIIDEPQERKPTFKERYMKLMGLRDIQVRPEARDFIDSIKSRISKLFKGKSTKEDSETITQVTDSGDVIRYEKGPNGDMKLDTTDAQTKRFQEDKENKSKFFKMFASGDLLGSIKNIFSGKDKEEDKDEDKKKGFITRILETISKWVHFGAKTLLSIGGVVAGIWGLSKLGKKFAGTKNDPNMRKGKSTDELRDEFENSSLFEKATSGAKSLENSLRGRDMSTYEEDDFVSEYVTDRAKQRGPVKFIAKRIQKPLVTSYLNKKLGLETAEEIGEQAGKKAVAESSEKGLIRTIKGKLQARFEKILPHVSKSASKFGLNIGKGALKDASKNLVKRMGKYLVNLGKRVLVKIASKFPVINIVFAAKAFIEGATPVKARSILGILDKPSIGQLGLAGLCNALNEFNPLSLMGIIPTEWMVTAVAEVLELTSNPMWKEWREQRKKAQKVLDDYNEENGTTYNIEEYIRNVLDDENFLDIGVEAAEDMMFSNPLTMLSKQAYYLGKGARAYIPGLKNSETFNEGLKKLKEFNDDPFGSANKFGKYLGESGKQLWDTAKGKAGELWDKTKGKAGELWDKTKGKAGELWNKVKSYDYTQIYNILNDPVGFAYNIGKKVLKKVEEAWASITEFVPKVMEKIGEKINEVWTNVKTEIPKMWDSITKAMSETWEGLKILIPQLPGLIIDKTKEIYDSVKTKFIEFKDYAFKKIKKFGDYLFDLLAHMPDIPALVKDLFDNAASGKDKPNNIINRHADSTPFLTGKFLVHIFGSITNMLTSTLSPLGIIARVKGILSKERTKFFDNVEDSPEEATGSGSKIDTHTTQKGNFNRFGKSTIDESGCGPAVASTILKAYGKNVDINQAADYAKQNNYVGSGQGPDGVPASYLGDIFNSNGISARYTTDKNEMKASMKSGRPIALLGKDSSNTSKLNSPYGPSPHFIEAEGNKNGSTLIHDPEQNAARVYDTDKIVDNTKVAVITGGASYLSTDNATDRLVKTAKGWIGKDFHPGQGEQCANFVRAMFKEANVPVGVTKAAVDGLPTGPAMASSFAGDDVGQKIDLKDIQPGDVVMYQNTYGGWAPGTITHVGIYTGDGKITHRPTAAKPVTQEDLNYAKIRDIRRIADGAPTTSSGSPSSTESNSNSENIWDNLPGFFFKTMFRGLDDAPGGKLLKHIFGISSDANDSTKSESSDNSNIPLSKIKPSEYKKTIWLYLLGKGLSPAQVAGVMGCFEAESGNSPRRIEGDYLKGFKDIGGYDYVFTSAQNMNNWCHRLFQTYANDGLSIDRDAYKGNDGNYYPGVGLAQWTGPRAYNLYTFARKYKINWGDLSTQIRFFWNNEINGPYKYVLKHLKETSSVDQATEVFAKEFENSAMPDGEIQKRKQFAKQIYETFKDLKPSTETKKTNKKQPLKQVVKQKTGKGSGLSLLGGDSKTTRTSYSTSDSGLANKLDIHKFEQKPIKTINFTDEKIYNKHFTGSKSQQNRYTYDNIDFDELGKGSEISKPSVKKVTQLVNSSNTSTPKPSVRNNKISINNLSIDDMDKILHYLEIIANNTQYNAKFPEIVDILKSSMDAMSQINKASSIKNPNASSEIERYRKEANNTLNLLRQRLETIARAG